MRAMAIDCPAGPASAQPNLASHGDRLFLSWQEAGAEGRPALRFAVREAGGWGPARTIVEREDLLLNWADFPSLAVASDGTLAAHWLVRREGAEFSYDIAFSTSSDGGATWRPAVCPHRDGTATEHGFVSVVEEPGRRFSAIWLDGRAIGDGSGPMKLLYSRWEGEGFGPETVIDDDVCSCCQTSARATAHGLLVAYRDRAGERRDISIAERRDDGWVVPVLLHRDGWEVPYCPVNGPALDASDRVTAVAWFTAAGGEPRVLFGFGDDRGALAREPVRVDLGSPEGRVDVALAPDGSALVSWLERGPADALVLLRRVRPDGALLGPLHLARVARGRASGFPRLGIVHGLAYVAWTDPGPPSRVRMAEVRLDP
jgi:hypothetical protein